MSKSLPENVADPVADPGRIVHWRAVRSDHVGPRDVTIWLPGTETGPLPVIYAHDGENLFDPAVSVDDWPLEMDRAMGTLMAEGLGPAIIVGIWATDERQREYSAPSLVDDLPEDIAAAVALSLGGPPRGDAYLRFLVEELKPRVDAEFDTLRDPDNTCTFGISMGGVFAIEALATRPDVFSRAVAMSAHLPLVGSEGWASGLRMPVSAAAEIPAAWSRFARRMGPPDNRRLWVCRGTRDLDRDYGPTHTALVEGLLANGWRPVEHLEARVYVGAGHHGRYWAPRRVPEALRFLLEG